MRTVCLAGSTGSIGTQAIEVIQAQPELYRVVSLGARCSVDTLVGQAQALRPECVAVADEKQVDEVARQVPPGTEVVAGPDALASIARQADVVVNGVVGFAGLPVTMATLEAGRRLALANKESLIAGGPVVRRVRDTPGAEIVPVDSEHAAIHQCLRAGRPGEARRILLTASGGPFRGRPRAELAGVTVDDALAHPTWVMGTKVTIDSSTLMNKGLEVIEAHELFDMGYDDIEVVVHPQSVVHSMVEFVDGSTVAQLSEPDMRLPIAYALAHPGRSMVSFGSLDWSKVGRLDFEPPDLDAFPALALAYEAGRLGGVGPAWLNAANEVAVEAFLAGTIPWLAIPDVIKETIDGIDGGEPDSVEAVVEADRQARRRARRTVERRAA
ncbi:MAG: 1-deoxy-D-xylulose-5-phosphate reductoisomerase [Actinomycetota bacterium]|nr:1-deoxy-D-xylulose-5-phosphate reductoisomerase [Actinomycetota bacterium]